MAEPTDDMLAQRAHRDVDAFAELYRRHLQRVYSYLFSRTGNADDAQDLTAQTFLTALEGIRAYRPQGTFGAWLLGIARHKAADFYRRETVSAPLDADVPDDAPAPEIVAGQRLQMRDVADALARINPDRADALRLRIFGGLEIRAVALEMGRSEGAVKMLIARALDDIRTLLGVPAEETTP